MSMNDYVLEWYVRGVLEEARAASARAALARRRPRLRPALASVLAAARTLVARAPRPRSLANAR